MWGRRGIVPLILNLGIRWRWVVDFRPQLLFAGGRALSTHALLSWLGCRTSLHVSERGNILPLLARLQFEWSGFVFHQEQGVFLLSKWPSMQPPMWGVISIIAAGGTRLTIDLHLWPKLILSGAVPPFLYTPVWCVQWWHYSLCCNGW
jgi:hypothetical protein